MLNVLLVVHDFSGVRTYIDELSNLLSRRSDVFIFQIFLNNSNSKEFTIKEKGSIRSIFIPDKLNQEYNEKYYKRCAQLVYSQFNDLQNVVIHANMPEQYLFVDELKKMYKCPVVFTFHFLMSFYSYFDRVSGYDSEITYNGNVLEKYMLEIANHIICVTNFGQRAVCQLRKVDKLKTSVIYNGKSLSATSLTDVSGLKMHYGFLPNDRIILYAGQLEPRKGIDILIKAFLIIKKHFPTTKLVIVGDGEYNSYLPLTQDCVGSIHFTGKLNRNKLYDFYRFSEVGVIPSQYEQCSYVAIEMMQYKLPLIISDVPGLNELVIHKKTGLVCKSSIHNTTPLTLEADESDLACKIEFLLKHPLEAKKFAKEAYRYTNKYHSIEKMGNETLKIYQQLILSW